MSKTIEMKEELEQAFNKIMPDDVVGELRKELFKVFIKGAVACVNIIEPEQATIVRQAYLSYNWNE